MFGSGMSLEDVGAMIFNPSILGMLTSRCHNGTWCLGNKEDPILYEEIDEAYIELCPLTGCLLDIPDECMDEVGKVLFLT